MVRCYSCKGVTCYHLLTHIKDSIGYQIGMIRNNKFRNTNKSKLKSIKVRGNKLNKGWIDVTGVEYATPPLFLLLYTNTGLQLFTWWLVIFSWFHEHNYYYFLLFVFYRTNRNIMYLMFLEACVYYICKLVTCQA